MKDELYYLLINTKTAINKLRMSYEELADTLGVSVDSISRWLNNRQIPSELNRYKLHWFVYLVLNMNVSFYAFEKYYALDNLTLETNPLGDGYSSPWGNSVDAIVTKKLIKHDSNDHLYIDFAREKNPDGTSRKLADVGELYTDKEYLQIMLESRDDYYLEEYYSIESCFDKIFMLNGFPHQEAIRRIQFLKKLCDSYIESTNNTLFDHTDTIMDDYIRVKDFRSFYVFLDDFHFFSESDERFVSESGGFKIVLSKYSDPVMKSVNRVIVKCIDLSDDEITFICEDGSDYTFINDDRFKINNTSSTSSHDFNFMIRVDKDYYALSFEYAN